MGSVSYHRDKGQSNIDFLRSEIVTDPSWGEVLDAATVGGTVYAAVRLGEKHGAEAGQVRALVVQTHWSRGYYNFTYKDQDESVGPYESDAPAKILDLLTPTDDEYALAWRARCRENLVRKAAAKAVRPGTVVRFAEPIEFTNDYSGDTFRLVERSTFAAVDTGSRYRIPSWKNRAYEVVA